MLELGKLQRMATRYSETVREHTYLVGLMNLALQTGDINLLARTEKRLAETELERNECLSALQVIGPDVLSAPPKDNGGELSGFSQTREYATA